MWARQTDLDWEKTGTLWAAGAHGPSCPWRGRDHHPHAQGPVNPGGSPGVAGQLAAGLTPLGAFMNSWTLAAVWQSAAWHWPCVLLPLRTEPSQAVAERVNIQSSNPTHSSRWCLCCEACSESPQLLGLACPFYFILPLVVHDFSSHQT